MNTCERLVHRTGQVRGLLPCQETGVSCPASLYRARQGVEVRPSALFKPPQTKLLPLLASRSAGHKHCIQRHYPAMTAGWSPAETLVLQARTWKEQASHCLHAAVLPCGHDADALHACARRARELMPASRGASRVWKEILPYRYSSSMDNLGKLFVILKALANGRQPGCVLSLGAGRSNLKPLYLTKP